MNTVWKYYLFVFLKGFSLISAVLVPFFTDWGHITLFQVQLLQSWFMLWIFLFEVPTGAVADYFGRKYSLALGALIITFAALLYGSIPAFEVFLLAELLFAAGVALVSGADQALLYDSLKELGREKEAGKIFGRAHSISLVGMVAATPIGALLAQRFDLNAPMLFTAVPYLLAAFVAFTFKEPKVREKVSETTRYVEVIVNGFKTLKGNRVLQILAIDAIVVASSAYFVIWLYQPLLKSINFPLVYFGIGAVLLTVSEIVVANNFSLLEKISGSVYSLLRYSALLVFISFILVALIPNLATISIFIIFAGGFGLTRLELMSAHMNKFIPSGQRATVLSSISMFRRLSLVVLNPVVGLLSDFSLTGALIFVGILPLLIFLFSPLKREMLGED